MARRRAPRLRNSAPARCGANCRRSCGWYPTHTCKHLSDKAARLARAVKLLGSRALAMAHSGFLLEGIVRAQVLRAVSSRRCTQEGHMKSQFRCILFALIALP